MANQNTILSFKKVNFSLQIGDIVYFIPTIPVGPNRQWASTTTPHMTNDRENIFLISKQGKIFCINSNEIYCSNEYSLGYLNEKTQLKNDYFLKIMASNHYLDIETNKNKSARLDLNKLNFKSNKSNFLIDFLKLDNDEYLENCFRLKNFLN